MNLCKNLFLVHLSYLFFTIIYYFCGGTDAAGNPYIYFIMDWRSPGASIGYTVLCLVSVVFLHLVVCGFYRLRKFIHDELCGLGNKFGETEELFWPESKPGWKAPPVYTVETDVDLK